MNGQGQGNDLLRPYLSRGAAQLVIVFSTLVIAALFNPQKRRKQGFVDRRFYTQRSAVEEHSPNVVELCFSEVRTQNPVLSLALIHRSAWNWNSPKFISKILHSPTPLELVTPMDRYARSWMPFLQANVCTSERTPHPPSRYLEH